MDACTREKSITEARSVFNDLLSYVRAAAPGSEAHEVERGVFRRLIRLGLAAMNLYFAEKGTGDVGPQMTGPRRGETLKRERLRPRDYYSLFGKFAVPRTCYRSPGQEGAFPLDAEANLPARCYSYLLQEWATGIAVKDTFEETVNYMEKWFGYRLPKSAVEEMTRYGSADYDAYYEEKARTPEGVAARLMGFETPEAEADSDAPRAQEKRYLASLERPKKEVMKVIREDAHARLLEILRGNVGRLIGGLKQSVTKRKLKGARRKAVEQVIGYLSRNRKAMRYEFYLAAGLPIATGVVESACGHLVKNRMEGAGMRWTEAGAEAVLLLRSVRASGDEEQYWAFHARRRKTILYQPFLSPEQERPAA